MSENFIRAFSILSNHGYEHEFNPNWSNGTGYFDHAVNGVFAPGFAPGQMAVSTEIKGPNVRKLIFIGTRFGNVVLFTRFSNDTSTIVCNVPVELRILFWLGFFNGEQTETQINGILGSEGLSTPFADNIGARLESMLLISPLNKPVTENSVKVEIMFPNGNAPLLVTRVASWDAVQRWLKGEDTLTVTGTPDVETSEPIQLTLGIDLGKSASVRILK